MSKKIIDYGFVSNPIAVNSGLPETMSVSELKPLTLVKVAWNDAPPSWALIVEKPVALRAKCEITIHGIDIASGKNVDFVQTQIKGYKSSAEVLPALKFICNKHCRDNYQIGFILSQIHNLVVNQIDPSYNAIKIGKEQFNVIADGVFSYKESDEIAVDEALHKSGLKFWDGDNYSTIVGKNKNTVALKVYTVTDENIQSARDDFEF